MSKSIYNARLVAFGDSITAGIGVPEGSQKWTDIIQARFNLDLINAGIGGNTSTQGLERIETDVLSHRPDFVTLNFSMNDHCMLESGEPRVSLPIFSSNITQMIQKINKIGAVPLLVTTNYFIEGDLKEYYYSRHDPALYKEFGGAQAWLDQYIRVIRQLAAELSVGLVDVRKECENYNRYEFLRTLENDTSADGVHPHALGAKVYGRLIGDYLEANHS